MARPPAFQLYARDFLADPLVDAMEPEELGGYFRLLLVAWQQDEPGYLPNDQVRLASWSRLGRRWKKHGPAIMRCFRVASDGRLFQKRMVLVAADQDEYREQQRQKGLASGEARRRAAADRESNRGSTGVQPRLVSGSNRTRTEPPTEREPEGNSASASASESFLSRARVGGVGALGTEWSGAGLPGLPSGVDLVALAADLETVDLSPRDACRSFKKLLEGWRRRNVVCSPTPAKLREHLGLVQQVASGEIDPSQIGRPPPGGRQANEPEQRDYEDLEDIMRRTAPVVP